MQCVYCLRDSRHSVQRAHVFPEGIVPGGPVLPLGVECDKCNAYAGQKLESVLVRHPLIAFPLQLLGLSGKKGKPRKKLGIFEHAPEDDAALRFPVEPPRVTYTAEGVRQFKFSPVVDADLDYARVSRALHHIAFNFFALQRGADAALDSKFDSVRQFVRAPKHKDERWTYAQVCLQLRTFEPQCGAELKFVGGLSVVLLHLHNAHFWVDLENTGRLLTGRFGGNAQSASIIGPDWSPPTPAPLEDAGDGMVRHYRLDIT